MEHLKQFYVAIDGNDSNEGTEFSPFATIDKARQEVRKFKKNNKKCDITVYIRGGFYTITETIFFGLEDSGSEQQTISYKAYPGETPIISSGKRIKKWTKMIQNKSMTQDHPNQDDDLFKSSVSEKVINNIWTADISEIIKEDRRFFTLYDSETRLNRSISDGFSPTNDGDFFTGSEEEHRILHYPENAPIKNWANIDDIELILRGAAAWQMSILPIKSIDMHKKTMQLATPSLYKISKTLWINDNSKTVWIENIPEFINKAGDWAVDTKSRKIYLWPLGEAPSENIFVPLLKEFIRVEGAVDSKSISDIPVKFLNFEGLTFLHGERDCWPTNYHGYELQHSWDLFDRENALIRFRGAENCTVKDCRFAHSGGGAIRLDLHCKYNLIRGNLIEHIGGTGILLAGYGPGHKDVNKENIIVNNYIKHIGEIFWHSLGIFVWQSGENKVSNNYLKALPYTAIGITGRISFEKGGECYNTIRWDEIDGDYEKFQNRLEYLHSRDNIIERNEIVDVCKIMGDGNGIYVSGAGTRNKVLNNYIHDNPSPHFAEGIRCDDDQDGTLIKDNIIFRTGGLGTGITSKGVNHIINNIVACPLNETKRGMISLELGPVKGSIIQKNILYATSKTHNAYFQERLYGNGPHPRFRDTDLDYNLYFNEKESTWGKKAILNELPFGIDAHSLEQNPMFYDIHKGDFRLASNSPALLLGIHPIDTQNVGLTMDFIYSK